MTASREVGKRAGSAGRRTTPWGDRRLLRAVRRADEQARVLSDGRTAGGCATASALSHESALLQQCGAPMQPFTVLHSCDASDGARRRRRACREAGAEGKPAAAHPRWLCFPCGTDAAGLVGLQLKAWQPLCSCRPKPDCASSQAFLAGCTRATCSSCSSSHQLPTPTPRRVPRESVFHSPGPPAGRSPPRSQAKRLKFGNPGGQEEAARQ